MPTRQWQRKTDGPSSRNLGRLTRSFGAARYVPRQKVVVTFRQCDAHNYNCMCTGRTTRAPPRTAVPGEGSAAALTMALTDLTPLRQAVDVLSSSRPSRRRRPGYVHKYGINVLKITSRNLYAASARLYLTTSSQFCSQ